MDFLSQLKVFSLYLIKISFLLKFLIVYYLFPVFWKLELMESCDIKCADSRLYATHFRLLRRSSSVLESATWNSQQVAALECLLNTLI